jgi:hypothetical protein
LTQSRKEIESPDAVAIAGCRSCKHRGDGKSTSKGDPFNLGELKKRKKEEIVNVQNALKLDYSSSTQNSCHVVIWTEPSEHLISTKAFTETRRVKSSKQTKFTLPF